MRSIRSLLFVAMAAIVALNVPFVSDSYADDKGAYEVHEWSVWFATPDIDRINDKERFPNAMPSSAKTTRTGKAERGEPRSGPVHVMTFYGGPVKDLDVGIKLDGGRYVGHWPLASTRQARLRWRAVELAKDLKDDERLPFIGSRHWAQQVREFDALYVRTSDAVERFLAYDVEIPIAVPFKIEGGPDRYQLFNGTPRALYDVVVSVPVEGGRRIGWLDELPGKREPQDDNSEEQELKRLAAETVLEGDTDQVTSLAVSPVGGIVAIGGADGSVTLRKVIDGGRVRKFTAHDGAVHGLAFSQNGQYLGTGGDDHLAKLWQSPSGKLAHTYEGHEDAVLAVTFTPNDRYLATAGRDNKVAMWWVSNGQRRSMQPGHRGEIRSLDSSAKVNLVVSASADRTARLWATSGTYTSMQRGTFKGHTGAVNAVAFSPDGEMIASGGDDKKLKLWDSQTRQQQATISLDGELVAVDYSPDGLRLITATRGSSEATVWSVGTREPKAILSGHSGEITSIAFVPETGLVATGSADGTTRLWKVSSDAIYPESIYGGEAHEIVMSDVLSAGSDELAAKGETRLGELLVANGLSEEEARLIVSEYGPAVFGSKQLVVLCRLPTELLDERVLLDLYPEPAKKVRVGLLLVRNVDPQIKIEAAELVKRLGDADYAAREAAEKRLGELGRLAVPALKQGLNHDDLEVVFRAERILLSLGESLDGQAVRLQTNVQQQPFGIVLPAGVSR